MKALTSLSLRFRLALFFALIAAGSVGAVFAGVWIGMSRGMEAGVLGALSLSALVTVAGTVSLTVWVALRFDQHVARPIDHLASELRVRSKGIHHGDVNAGAGQYLGALGPAVAEVNDVLRDMREEMNWEIQARTGELEHAVDVLADILGTLPTGIVAATKDHRISHLNGPALHLLADEGPVGLGRDVQCLIDPVALNEARDQLTDVGAPSSITFIATTLGTHRLLHLRIALLHADDHSGGYVLALPEATSAPEGRAKTVHDAGLHTARGDGLAALSFVVFDSETTGLDPAGGDDLVQLAGVRIVNGKTVIGDVFDTLIDPERPIPRASTAVHRITDEMVRGAPKADEAVAAFHAWCGDSVLVAHNTAFDMAFLRKAAPGAGVTFDQDTLDTVHLSAICFPHESDHRLDALMERLGVSWDEEDRHTALGDSKMTAECLRCMLPLLKEQLIDSLADVDAARGAFRNIARAQQDYERPN